MTEWNRDRIQRRLARLVALMMLNKAPTRDMTVAGLLLEAVWLAWQTDDTRYLDRLLDAVQPVMEEMVLDVESSGDLPVIS